MTDREFISSDGVRLAYSEVGHGTALRVVQRNPNFRLVEVQGGGHVANLDARDAVRMALLEFWESPAQFNR